MNPRAQLVVGTAVSLALCSASCAGPNPLSSNLKALEARARAGKAAKAAARRAPAPKVARLPKPAPVPKATQSARTAPIPKAPPLLKAEPVVTVPRAQRPQVSRPAAAAPRVRMARAMLPAPGEITVGPVRYAGGRFGSKPEGGDLIVTTTAGRAKAHVYVKQRLVSNGGDGRARVPDLAPGKYPVLLWAPDRNRRRTFWVKIRPGRVAELRSRL